MIVTDSNILKSHLLNLQFHTSGWTGSSCSRAVALKPSMVDMPLLIKPLSVIPWQPDRISQGSKTSFISNRQRHLKTHPRITLALFDCPSCISAHQQTLEYFHWPSTSRQRISLIRHISRPEQRSTIQCLVTIIYLCENYIWRGKHWILCGVIHTNSNLEIALHMHDFICMYDGTSSAPYL